jgi:hypothetical protein
MISLDFCSNLELMMGEQFGEHEKDSEQGRWHE